MAGRVEALPLGEDPRRVELGVEDPLLAVERPGEVRAVGREDRAAAAADRPGALDLGAQREVVGIRALALEVARRDDVRAALPRQVDERRLPRVAVVCGGRDVELQPDS